MSEQVDIDLRLRQNVATQAKAAQKGITNLGNTTVKEGSRMNATFKRIATTMAAGLGLRQLVKLGTENTNMWRTQAKAIAQVEAGLKSTGAVSGKTLDELKEKASALQNDTLFGDEEILTGVTAQILTFSNIANAEFDRTQEVALDLATRLGTDLKSASIQLGKALNDPITGLSMLSRSGITFDAEQKELINSLWNTGHAAEAQNVILAELERQYGGSAKAAAAADGGFTQLSNTIGDVREVLGKMTTEALSPAAVRLKEFLSDLSEDDIREFVNNVKGGVKVVTSLTAALAGYKLVLAGAVAIKRAGAAIDSVRLMMMFRKELGLAKAAQQAFNITSLANPYIAIGAAVLAGAIAAFALFKKRADAAVTSQDKLNASMSEAESIGRSEVDRTNNLVSIISNENIARDARNKKLQEFIDLAPDQLNGLSLENIKTEEGIGIINRYVAAKQKQIKLNKLIADKEAAQDVLADANDGKNDVSFWKKMGASLASSGGGGMYGMGASSSPSYSDLVGEMRAEKNKEVADDQLDYIATIDKAIEDLLKPDENSPLPIITEVEKQRTLELIDDEIAKQKELQKTQATTAEQYMTYQKQIDALEKEKNGITGEGMPERLEVPVKLKIDDTDYAAELDAELDGEMEVEIKADVDKYQENLKSLLVEYRSYEQQRADLVKEYAAKRAVLEAAGATEQVESLNIEEVFSLSELDTQAQGTTGAIGQMFQDMGQESIDSIQSIIDKSQKLLSYLESGEFKADGDGNGLFGLSEEQFKDWGSADGIAKLKEQLGSLTDTQSTLAGGFDKIKIGLKGILNSGGDIGKLKGGFASLSGGLSATINGVQTLSSITGDLVSTFADLKGVDIEEDSNSALARTSQIAEGIGEVAGETAKFSKLGSAFGPVGMAAGAVVGLAVGVVKQVAKVRAENKELEKNVEDTRNAITASIEKYNMDLGNIQKAYNTTFGNNDLGADVVGAVKSYRLAKAARDKYLRDVKKADVKTKEGGWFHSDTYKKIIDLYPSLIDRQGNLNVQVAEGVIETAKLSDEEKAALQGAIDSTEAMETAMESMSDYMASLFNNMASDSVAAFQAMYEGADDAASMIGDSFADMYENLINDQFINAKIQPIYEKYDADIEDLNTKLANDEITQDEYDQSARRLALDASLEIEKKQGEYNEWVSEADQQAADAGRDEAFNADDDTTERTGTSESIAQASQDSIDELSGRLLAAGRNLADMNVLDREAALMRDAMVGYLSTIAENTGYNKKLENIDNTLIEIQTRGIKVKS